MLACLAVAVLSLLPGTALPPVAFNVWDKAQHAGAFAVLVVLGLLWAFPHQPVAGVGALLVYGVFIELAQGATGWRYGDWHDWLADAVEERASMPSSGAVIVMPTSLLTELSGVGDAGHIGPGGRLLRFSRAT